MKGNKGITLIALVVTIIVLLILAGVAIAMLRGDNGILNRATEAKYENVIGSFNEQVKLAHMSTRTAITANMVNAGNDGYIATTKANFTALKDAVVKELGATEAEPSSNATQEGYIVYSYLTDGDTTTDGEGFIIITYSDNALRSSLPKDIVEKSNGSKVTLNSTEFTVATSIQPVGASETKLSVNQAVLAYVIRVSNYNCQLSNAILTDTTDRSAVNKKVTSSSAVAAASFCKTTVNPSTGAIQVDTDEGTVIGKKLTF